MTTKALTIGTLLSLFVLIMIPEVGVAKKPPSDEDPSAAGELYGDLYVLERDGAGVPLTREVTYEAYEGGTVTVDCLQPLAADCGLLPLWGECDDQQPAVLPLGVLPLPECTFDPEAHDACELYTGVDPYDYGNDLQEVSFGRGSVTRSQAFVIDSSYGEFLKVINDAAALRLDPAGRFEMEIESEAVPGVWSWKTVDAPLENLGLYREAMINGCLGAVVEEKVGEEGAAVNRTSALDPSAIVLLRDLDLGLRHLVCSYANEPDTWDAVTEEWDAVTEVGCLVTDDEVGLPADTPCWWESPEVPDRGDPLYLPGEDVEVADMQSATAFLAAATDKSNPMSLDELININTYIGINTSTFVKNKKDRVLIVEYFPFADPEGPDSWFGYERLAAFPDDETAELLVYDGTDFFAEPSLSLFDGSNGYLYDFVDLDAVNLTVCRQGSAHVEICDDAWADITYDGITDFGCGGADWFAQQTEHARKTVWYLHNWSVPELNN